MNLFAVCYSSGTLVAATGLQTDRTGAGEKQSAGLAAGPDSRVGAQSSASLVGTLSSLNDRDWQLLSVCVVSRWFLVRRRRVLVTAQGRRPSVCPLAVSDKGPWGVTCSWSFVQENLAVEYRKTGSTQPSTLWGRQHLHYSLSCAFTSNFIFLFYIFETRWWLTAVPYFGALSVRFPLRYLTDIWCTPRAVPWHSRAPISPHIERRPGRLRLRVSEESLLPQRTF